MLRNLGIRAKILVALAVPVVLLLVLASGLVKSAIDRRETAQGYESTLARASQYTQLVRALQSERSLTQAVMAGDITRKDALKEVRGQITDGMSDLGKPEVSTDHEVANSQITEIWQGVLDFNQALPELRVQIDEGSITPQQAYKRYTDGIDQVLAIPPTLSQAVPLPAAQSAMTTLHQEEIAIEALMQERDTLSAVILQGGLSSEEQRAQVQSAILRRAITDKAALSNAEIRGVELAGPNQALLDIEQQMLALEVGERPSATVASLSSATDEEIGNLSAVTDQVLEPAIKDVQKEVDSANSAMMWTIAAALAALILLALLARAIASGISAPLERLTLSVSRIHDELPKLVDRDNPDQKVALSEDLIVDVESNDEVGRLAQAFNDVNRSVVENANQQAELRASIAGMFVNVARRDQTLLSRQLGLIDQLERTEEDPQTLATLFKLDHLSTRMRRNAEALLVLAGIDTGRRLRRPMALSDVVRTASSEIEHYDRVDLVQTVDPQMLGHTALTAASLLAELLENATAFSDPNSRVSARTENSPKGVAVIITDDGLGMTDAEVAEANEKIASASLAEVVSSKRLGLFVVGRLARRLEADVVISPGAKKGVMARVDFPPSAFVPGAVTHVADAAEPPKPRAEASAGGSPAATAPARMPTPTPMPMQSTSAEEALAQAKPADYQPTRPAKAAGKGGPAASPQARDAMPKRGAGHAPAAAPQVGQTPPARGSVKPDAEARVSQARPSEPRAPRPSDTRGKPDAEQVSQQASKRAADQPIPVPGVSSAHGKAAGPKADDAKPAEGKPAASRPADKSSAESKKPQPKPADAGRTDAKPAEARATDADSAKAGTDKPTTGPQTSTALPSRGARSTTAMPKTPTGAPSKGNDRPGTPGKAASAAGDSVPGPRSEAARAAQRGGLFSSFRSRRADEESAKAEQSSSGADSAQQEKPAAAAPAGETGRSGEQQGKPAEPGKAGGEDKSGEPATPAGKDKPGASTAAADKPAGKPAAQEAKPAAQGTPKAQAEPKAASPAADGSALPGRMPTVPATTSQDILPGGGGRRPGRGGSLFARLGDQPNAASHGASAAAGTPSAPPASEIPARRSASEDAPVVAAAPRSADAEGGFAAEALSELGRLQAYRPSRMATGASSGGDQAPTTLVRRQAGATPAGKLPPKPQAPSQRRNRTAADVRSMLSGFQAGVERGRSGAEKGDESS